jgi:hypothetical protein
MMPQCSLVEGLEGALTWRDTAVGVEGLPGADAGAIDSACLVSGEEFM